LQPRYLFPLVKALWRRLFFFRFSHTETKKTARVLPADQQFRLRRVSGKTS